MNNELWDNPLFPIEERLLMAKGAIQYRDAIIENLQSQLKNQHTVDSMNYVDRQSGAFTQDEIDNSTAWR